MDARPIRAKPLYMIAYMTTCQHALKIFSVITGMTKFQGQTLEIFLLHFHDDKKFFSRHRGHDERAETYPRKLFSFLSTVMGIFFPLNTDMMKFQRQPPKSFFSSSPR